MRLTFHWRGKPLVGVDLVAMSPAGETGGPTLEASGHLQDSTRAEPMQPDCTTFGFGARPESLR